MRLKYEIMRKHIIGIVLASIIVSYVMMLLDKHDYIGLVPIVLLGTAFSLTVIPLVALAVPTLTYWVITRKKIPYMPLIFWLLWSILAIVNMYNNYLSR